MRTDEGKNYFMANITHEIRTPLNGILGLADLAISETDESVRLEYLHKIKKSAEMLLSVTNSVLDYARIDAGKMPIESIPFNVGELLSECRDLLYHATLEKGLEFHLSPDWDIGLCVMGDPTKLRQALVNLLSNAIKFTASGYVKLSARWEGEVENTVTLGFEVADTGIGIQPAKVEKIFIPFEQADEGIVRKYGGTGLGLTITQRLVEMMGGRLSLESVSDVGSKFTFSLPFLRHFPTPEEVSVPVFNISALVIDDDAVCRQILMDNLKKINISVAFAENGKEGLDAVHSNNFDIIFTDVQMPVLDGAEVVKTLRAEGYTKPIVVVSAEMSEAEQAEYASIGASDSLLKPVTEAVLSKTLRAFFIPVREKTKAATHKNGVHLSAAAGIKNCANDPGLYKGTLEIFLRDCDATYETACNAAIKGDIPLLLQTAHRECSYAAMVGALRLSEILREICQLCKSEKTQGIDKLLELYGAELSAVKALKMDC